MLKNISAKNKTFLFVALVMVFFSTVLLGIIYVEQKAKLKNFEEHYFKNIKRSYTKILEKHNNFYQNRIKANIRSKGVKDALENLDRKRLLDLSKGRWKTLSSENPYLKIMHFHKPDGTSFLRMHQADRYGDNLSDTRTMIKTVHEYKKPLYGFEKDQNTLAYRTIMPIFKNKKYIGALEFGVKPEQILEEMLYFNELHGALFIKGNKKGKFNIGDYSLLHKTEENYKIIEQLKKSNYRFKTFEKIKVDGCFYDVYSFALKDFEGKQTAKIVFFNDITQIEEDIEKTLKELFLLSVILLILLLVVVNFGFKNIIEVLDEKNKQLKNTQDSMQEQKDELETIFHTSKDGIAILDFETKFLFFNDSYLKMTGFTYDELLTKSCVELSAPQDLQRAINIIEVVKKDGYVENFEKTCIVKNNKKVRINMAIALMPDKKRFLINTKDITQADKIKKTMQRYVDLIDKNVITSTTDLKDNIISVSEAFCKISGYSKEELIGKKHNIIRDPNMPSEIYKDLWDNLKQNKSWQGEIRNKKKDGSFYWVKATISPVFDDEGKKTGYTAIREDITDKKYIEEISITDGLTNIYNRRHFNEIFPKVINSAKRKNELICFLIMDVDHFKQYNDTYGHQMGDEALKAVAKVLKTDLKRSDDYCFRLGGEEFGVIFKVDEKQKSDFFSNYIRKSIEDLKIEHKGNSASDYLTASMGLVCLNARDIKDPNEIYKMADELLYNAKQKGRNQVVNNIKM